METESFSDVHRWAFLRDVPQCAQIGVTSYTSLPVGAEFEILQFIIIEQ